MRWATTSPGRPGDVAVEDGEVVGVDARAAPGPCPRPRRCRRRSPRGADRRGWPRPGRARPRRSARALLDSTSRHVSSGYREPHTHRQHAVALAGAMSSSDPGAIVVRAGLAVPSSRVAVAPRSSVAAVVGFLGDQPSAASVVSATPRARRASRRLDGRRRGPGLGADGSVPDGVTVFDDDGPRRRQPRRRPARRPPPGRDRCRRRRRHVRRQQRLAFRASTRTSCCATRSPSTARPQEAARWVATADTSPHVQGDAIDVGPWAATSWLSEHGAAYGLCQVYANEPWHYELRPDAVDARLPRPCTPTRRTTRGCSSDRPPAAVADAPAHRRPVSRAVRGLPRAARVDRAVEARGPRGSAWRGSASSSSSRSSPRAEAGASTPADVVANARALRALRRSTSVCSRPSWRVVEGRGRGRGSEPGPRGRPVRPGGRQRRRHRRRRQHRRGSGRARLCRAGTAQTPGSATTVLTRVCSIGTVLACSRARSSSPRRCATRPPEDVRCTPSLPCGPPGDPGDGGPARDAVFSS